ncbi:male sterility protein domain-containing protein [Phthorimaea operculella]|nr:male sterility protein domain-containing protein [Phthorimaea operculella]
MAALVVNKDFGSCCRTCLNDASNKMHDIFSEGQNSVTIAEMLNLCTSLKVVTEDDLPKKLCGSCYNCLLSFYDFRKLAEKIDAQLRNHNTKQLVGETKTSIEVKIEVEHPFTKQEIDCDQVNGDLKDIKQEFNFIHENSDDRDDFSFDEFDTEEVKPVLKCELCYRKFSSLAKLETHLKRNSCETIFTCNFCSRTFKRHHKYVKHLVTHGQEISEAEINQNEPNTSLDCTTCSKRFRSANSLAAHMRKHTKKGRVLACSICNKVFKKISHVKRHELCHDENRPFQCTVCAKRFNTESMLSEHMDKHNKVKGHTCPICNKSFAHLSTLSSHVKLHTREKPYLCPTCGKRFDSTTNLNQHVRRHMGLKMFACTMCPKKFVTKGELQSHEVTHKRELVWRCEQCPAAFYHKKSLQQHRRRHAGVKPHRCDTCPMRFLTKDHLKRHYRIHTGEKPYKCQHCERAFTQSGDLLKHTRAHLGDKMYKCTECPESFRLQSELRQMVDKNMKRADSLVPDIPGFYKGKSIFITGGAGFMGKVLVERILSTCPDVGNIYLLMREKKDLTPEKRLQQLKQSKVFEILRVKQPLQLDKLVAVSGDMTKPGFGFSTNDRDKLNEVSIIFHSAASLSMNAPLPDSVESNIQSTVALLAFADKLPKIEVFIYVSTLYSNIDLDKVEEKVYPPPMQLKSLLDLVDDPNFDKKQENRIIGLKHNSYVFTKSIAEYEVTKRGCSKYAVGVVRPGVVICSLRDPFPGWVENFNGATGVIANVLCGVLRVLSLDISENGEMVPVDIAIHTFIAAAWELAVDRPAEVRFYNCTSQENPITWTFFVDAVNELSAKYPSLHAVAYPHWHIHKSWYLTRMSAFLLETIPFHFMEFVFSVVNKRYKPRIKKQLSRVEEMRKAVRPLVIKGLDFRNENVQRLRRRLCERDRALFNLEPSSIDWHELMLYLVRGTRRHVLKEPDSTLEEARTRVRRMGCMITAAKYAFMLAGLVIANFSVKTVSPLNEHRWSYCCNKHV